MRAGATYLRLLAMRVVDIALCVVCVCLVSVGQVMLRAASLLAYQEPQIGLRAWLNGTTLSAIFIYGCAMLMWLWLLGRVPLSQAFAFFGLSFFLVPIIAHRFLGDAVSVNTWVGAAIIMLGIMVTNLRSS